MSKELSPERAQSAKELLHTIIGSIGIAKTLELMGTAVYEISGEYGGGWRALALQKVEGVINKAASDVRKIQGMT
jgi:hypothetical protein